MITWFAYSSRWPGNFVSSENHSGKFHFLNPALLFSLLFFLIFCLSILLFSTFPTKFMSFFLFYTSYQIMRSNNSIFTNRFLFETNQRKLQEVASSNVTSSTLKFNETAEILVYVISLSSLLLVRKSPICSYLIRKILPVSFVNKESRPFFTTTPTQPLMWSLGVN